MKRAGWVVLWLAVAMAWGCGDDVPEETSGDTDGTGSDAGGDTGTGDVSDAGGGSPWDDEVCEPKDTDYSPGVDDAWAVCISDDGAYHQIEENVSSIARVAAFEEIADLLWRGGVPTSEDFIAARDLYATGEGIDSRLQRREDEHYPPVMSGETVLSCRDEGVPEMDPNRCVGPALMLPLVVESFAGGIEGNSPEFHAARIEAVLVWFFYLSSYKEATTCATTRKDCDSSWAYYTGGQQRDDGIGLAGYIRAVAPEVHDRVFDGVLAVRCWRDLDNADAAEDLDLQAQALAQLDAAMLNGVARIVADRLAAFARDTGAAREGDWGFIQTLGPVLDREANERNPTVAATLEAAWAADIDDLDAEGTIEALAEVFPCP